MQIKHLIRVVHNNLIRGDKSVKVVLSLLIIAVLWTLNHRGESRMMLRNKSGTELEILTTGASIRTLKVKDREGTLSDIVLGFDDPKLYKDAKSPYFGAVVGRVANRIANAKFTLDGKEYKLAANNGPNCLHGGVVGFSRKEWTVNKEKSHLPHSIFLEYTSPDGEEGFPGTVHATVEYTLTDDDELVTEMTATTDAPTPINLAQHSYFNLAGHDQGDILSHTLHLPNADHVTPVDDVQIPTGEFLPVKDTPFDFLHAHTIGERIDQVPGKPPGGYDHNWVLFALGADAKDKVEHGMAYKEPRLAVTLKDPKSGRGMHVFTTAPGLQFYSGNFLDGTLEGKGGVKYPRHAGLALETQAFPNSLNEAKFPSVVIRPGEEYRHVVKYKFYTFE